MPLFAVVSQAFPGKSRITFGGMYRGGARRFGSLSPPSVEDEGDTSAVERFPDGPYILCPVADIKHSGREDGIVSKMEPLGNGVSWRERGAQVLLPNDPDNTTRQRGTGAATPLL